MSVSVIFRGTCLAILSWARMLALARFEVQDYALIIGSSTAMNNAQSAFDQKLMWHVSGECQSKVSPVNRPLRNN